MAKLTKQMLHWSGSFGAEYSERNAMTLDQMEQLWVRNYGFTRSSVNQRFLGGLDKSIRILEVGSNIGNQLLCLKRQGFSNLYGVELQYSPITIAKASAPNLTLAQASAFELPFGTDAFDLVFTSGLLIHIAPEDLSAVMDEIYRCTRRLIYGAEYYSKVYTSVEYRGHGALLWKGDFPGMFLAKFPTLRRRMQEHHRYLENENIDVMYLLEKI